MPSLRARMDRVPPGMPGFCFFYWEPRPGGMAMVALFSLAAEWPLWTERQAAAMGLVCAGCGWDLRPGAGVDQRLVFNIPLPAEPGLRRLVCGPCCNDGLDELRRLSAGQPI